MHQFSNMAMMYNITAGKTRRSTAHDARAGQETSTLALETSALAALETMPAVQETGPDNRVQGAASTDDGKHEHEDAANGVGSRFKVIRSLTRKCSSRFTAASQLPAPSGSSKGVPLPVERSSRLTSQSLSLEVTFLPFNSGSNIDNMHSNL